MVVRLDNANVQRSHCLEMTLSGETLSACHKHTHPHKRERVGAENEETARNERRTISGTENLHTRWQLDSTP